MEGTCLKVFVAVDWRVDRHGRGLFLQEPADRTRWSPSVWSLLLNKSHEMLVGGA